MAGGPAESRIRRNILQSRVWTKRLTGLVRTWVVTAPVLGYCWGIGATGLGAPAEGYRLHQLQRLCRRTEWNGTVTMETEQCSDPFGGESPQASAAPDVTRSPTPPWRHVHRGGGGGDGGGAVFKRCPSDTHI